ncbi:DUF397 domain-containing protein [Streptomyces sp. NPDC048416]|uniref:DUF397 domain-containing protein n=1 Tax=Streptomyces sp. NPDC048416 TaxID=3365546 RepID=UPI003715D28A
MGIARTWFKSSYSTEQGGNCLEVACDWRKSSYSSDEGGACVEIARVWRTSSYSGSDGGQCVEVGTHPSATCVHIRDSKVPEGPTLTLNPTTWQGFLTAL